MSDSTKPPPEESQCKIEKSPVEVVTIDSQNEDDDIQIIEIRSKLNESTKRPLEYNAVSMPAEKKKHPKLEEDAIKHFDIKIVHTFTTEDTKKPPWTDISRKLYGAKSRMFDRKRASVWMHWWLEEHQDMPDPPNPVPHSGFIMYFHEKCKELGIKTIGNKKIGAEWQALSKEEQAPWYKKHEERKEQFLKDEEKYEEDLIAWREEKMKKPKRTDGKPDCNCQYCLGDKKTGFRLPAIF